MILSMLHFCFQRTSCFFARDVGMWHKPITIQFVRNKKSYEWRLWYWAKSALPIDKYFFKCFTKLLFICQGICILILRPKNMKEFWIGEIALFILLVILLVLKYPIFNLEYYSNTLVFLIFFRSFKGTSI